jgi:hypothetical protein
MLRTLYRNTILAVFLLPLIALSETGIVSSIDKSEITIGERVKYSLTVTYPENTQYNTFTWRKLECLDSGFCNT